MPETPTPSSARRTAVVKVLLIVAVTLAVAFVPPPAGVDPRGMLMAGIFVGTILALILQPLPTASVCLVGLAAAMITGAMNPSTEALEGFANPAVWLIVASFFIAEGFLVTGLGRRIALLFVARLGRSSTGVAYGMALTDLVLAPATPSNTARAGGVLYPIIRSLAQVQDSHPDTPASRRRLGSYLLMTSVHVNAVTAAMFLTAMAGNPIAQRAAAGQGAQISWGTWALAGLVPGLVCLAIIPWVMARLYPPTVTSTPEAPAQAREELARLGRVSRDERVMIATFVLLLLMWSLGAQLSINATAAAFVGIAILLCTGVLTWKHLAADASAWSTLLFFGVLVGMADQLEKLGVIGFVGDRVAAATQGLGWPLALLILGATYFYLHYAFASNTAHIVAMYAVFLSAAIAAGAPVLFAAIVLGFLGNLFGALTHYASGPAGVVFGSGYVPVAEWLRVGLVMSVVLLGVWFGVGVPWMKVIGVW